MDKDRGMRKRKNQKAVHPEIQGRSVSAAKKEEISDAAVEVKW